MYNLIIDNETFEYSNLSTMANAKKLHLKSKSKEQIEYYWPFYKQLNCAMGIYDENIINECKNFIYSKISECNLLENQIDTIVNNNLLTDQEKVEQINLLELEE